MRPISVRLKQAPADVRSPIALRNSCGSPAYLASGREASPFAGMPPAWSSPRSIRRARVLMRSQKNRLVNQVREEPQARPSRSCRSSPSWIGMKAERFRAAGGLCAPSSRISGFEGSIDALPTPPSDQVYRDAGFPSFGVKVTPRGRNVFVVLYRIGGVGPQAWRGPTLRRLSYLVRSSAVDAGLPDCRPPIAYIRRYIGVACSLYPKVYWSRLNFA